jgi:hypothetical protein
VLCAIALTRVWVPSVCLQAKHAAVNGGSREQPLAAQQSMDSVSGPETPPAAFDAAAAADSSVPTWQTAGGQDWSGQSTGGLFGSGNGSATTFNISVQVGAQAMLLVNTAHFHHGARCAVHMGSKL